MTDDDGGQPADDTIDLSQRQRERLERIKSQCNGGGHLPKPADSVMLDALMDTWGAVGEGYYSDGGPSVGNQATKRVAVEREVLEDLVDTAKGDLERLVGSDGYREGDDIVDDLVGTIEAAERSLQANIDHDGGGR